MTFNTAQQISDLSLALLVRRLVLPRTVARVPGTDFTGDTGDTVSVRVRQPRTAKTQSTPGGAITFEAIDEVKVDVTVDHLYDATRINEHELSLEIAQFGEQVLVPMATTVALGAENQVAAAMNGLAADASFELTASPTNTDTILKQARESLSDNEAPAGGRTLACAPDVITRMLDVEKFVRADATGDGRSSALRDASFGRVYGFDVIESPALDAGTAVAYHESAFVWGNRAPAIPGGAAEAAVSTTDGVSIRTVRSYDTSIASDTVLVSTFAGASAVFEDGATATDRRRSYKIDTATA